MLVKGMSRQNWTSQSEQHILHTWCLSGWGGHYGRGSNSGSWWCQSKKWNERHWTSHLSNIPGASLNVGVHSGRGSNSGSWWCQRNEVAELNESSEEHTWCLTEHVLEGEATLAADDVKGMKWLNWMSHLRNIPGASLNMFWKGKQLWKLMNWVSLS